MCRLTVDDPEKQIKMFYEVDMCVSDFAIGLKLSQLASVEGEGVWGNNVCIHRQGHSWHRRFC